MKATLLLRKIHVLATAGLATIIALPAFAEDAVELAVEAGTRRVQLEVFRPHDAAWAPLSIAHLDGRAGSVKLEAPADLQSVTWRVRTSHRAAFPAGYFVPQRIPGSVLRDTAYGNWAGTNPLYRVDAGGFADAPEASGDAASFVNDIADSDDLASSDLWRFAGDRLFFYNYLRGLQVFDVSNPDAVTKTHYLRYPARGNELFLLNADQAVLIGADPRTGAGEAVVVGVDGSEASIVGRFDAFPGYILDARKLGDDIYFVVRSLIETETETSQSIHLLQVSFVDPTAPALVSETVLANGYVNVTAVRLVGDQLILALQSYNWASEFAGSRIQVISLASETPVRVGTVECPGTVPDDFKVEITNGHLFAVSQVRGPDQLQTQVTTWPLGPEGIGPVADELTLAPGEMLFANRFDGDRLYVVTFERIDPLFAVDIADPADLQLLGELEVPGWSTFIHPMGDRLLSVGVENNRVAISLFGVADPGSPTLLDRIYLGSEEHGSWSEANYDYLAVAFDASTGRLIVPFQSWSENASVASLALLTVSESDLTLSGTWSRFPNVKRSAIGPDTALSASLSELYVSDIADPANPMLDHSLRLAWNTRDIALLQDGSILAQVTASGQDMFPHWGEPVFADVAYVPTPNVDSLLLSPAGDPDTVLGELTLRASGSDTYTQMQLLGSYAEGATLYLMLRYPAVWTDPEPRIELVVCDVTDATAPAVLGRTTHKFEGNAVLPDRLQPVEVDENRLLWLSQKSDAPIYIGICGVEDVRMYPGIYYGSSALAAAANIADPATPVFEQVSLIQSEDSRHAFSSLHFAGGEILGSFRRNLQPSTDERLKVEHWLYRLDAANLEYEQLALLPGDLRDASGASAEELILITELEAYADDWKSTVTAAAWDGTAAFSIDAFSFDAPYGFKTDLFHHLSHYRVKQDAYYTVVAAPERDFQPTPAPTENAQSLERVRFETVQGRWVALPGIELEERSSEIVAFGDEIAWSDIRGLNLLENPLDPEATATLVPTNLAGVYNLDDSLFDPATGFWLVAKEFGTEHIALAEPDTASISETPLLLAGTGEADWIEVSSASVNVTNASSTDGLGILDANRWIFLTSDFAELDSTAADRGDLWRESEWFGWYQHSYGDRWVFHVEHGWIFGWETQQDGVWLYDLDTGWSWTHPSIYPFLFELNELAAGRSGWIYYLQGTGLNGMRWYYTDNGWEARNRSGI